MRRTEFTRNNGPKGFRANTALSRLAVLLLLAAIQTFAQSHPNPSTRSAPVQSTDSARRIIVSIPDHKLALVENGRVVKVYKVAVGAPDSPTPEGEFRIVRRLSDPTYYHPGVVIPPGPDNPLGPRWIGLNLKGFGIHGTNQPGSIGHRASHGCIRMRNEDVEELFALVREGDVVDLHGERDFATATMLADPKSEVARVDSSVEPHLTPAEFFGSR